MVSRESEVYKDALKKAMPNLDLSYITELYQKNLEYLSSVNKVMGDATKDLYHAKVDFVKRISALAKSAYEKAARDAKDPKKISEDTQEAMNVCAAVCSEYSEQVDSIMKAHGGSVSGLTEKHLKYATDKVKDTPVGDMFSKVLNPNAAQAS